jgi:hypothetical protein
MRNILLLGVVALSFLIDGCCKNKKDILCKSENIEIKPFLERYYVFTCGGNLYEYEYIMRRKSQIDSLTDCTFSPPVPFPIDETDFVYIMVGRTFEFYKDTFQTSIWKDTCAKKLIYEVNRIQRDTSRYCCPYGITAVSSMFCSVENIPPDYQVEVKYKYVPIE